LRIKKIKNKTRWGHDAPSHAPTDFTDFHFNDPFEVFRQFGMHSDPDFLRGFGGGFQGFNQGFNHDANFFGSDTFPRGKSTFFCFFFCLVFFVFFVFPKKTKEQTNKKLTNKKKIPFSKDFHQILTMVSLTQRHPGEVLGGLHTTALFLGQTWVTKKKQTKKKQKTKNKKTPNKKQKTKNKKQKTKNKKQKTKNKKRKTKNEKPKTKNKKKQKHKGPNFTSTSTSTQTVNGVTTTTTITVKDGIKTTVKTRNGEVKIKQ